MRVYRLVLSSKSITTVTVNIIRKLRDFDNLEIFTEELDSSEHSCQD